MSTSLRTAASWTRLLIFSARPQILIPAISPKLTLPELVDPQLDRAWLLSCQHPVFGGIAREQKALPGEWLQRPSHDPAGAEFDKVIRDRRVPYLPLAGRTFAWSRHGPRARSPAPRSGLECPSRGRSVHAYTPLARLHVTLISKGTWWWKPLTRRNISLSFVRRAGGYGTTTGHSTSERDRSAQTHTKRSLF